MQASELKAKDFKIEELRQTATGPIFIRVTYLPSQISVEAKGYSRGRLRRLLNEDMEKELKKAKVIE